MSELKKKIKKIRDEHYKGLCISEDALVELEQIFKVLDGFEHCQTGPDGGMEIILSNEDGDPVDNSISQALELLEKEALKDE